MIKTYCDVCNKNGYEKEITTPEMASFGYIEKASKLIFVKHQKQNQEGFIKKEFILCPECSDKVRKLLDI